MIISHSKKFAFCRIPKNASNAVAEAFMKGLVNGDQAIIHGADFFVDWVSYEQITPSVTDVSKPPSCHMRLQRAAEFGLHIGDDYKKVFVVRNPYDKFISACVNVLRRRAKALKIVDLADKIDSKMLQDAYEMDTQFIEFDNYDWFLDGFDESSVRIIRFENLQADFDMVTDEFGLDRVTIETVYPGLIPQSRYRELYSPELRAHVERIHANDFIRFGYGW